MASRRNRACRHIATGKIMGWSPVRAENDEEWEVIDDLAAYSATDTPAPKKRTRVRTAVSSAPVEGGDIDDILGAVGGDSK